MVYLIAKKWYFIVVFTFISLVVHPSMFIDHFIFSSGNYLLFFLCLYPLPIFIGLCLCLVYRNSLYLQDYSLLYMWTIFFSGWLLLLKTFAKVLFIVCKFFFIYHLIYQSFPDIHSLYILGHIYPYILMYIVVGVVRSSPVSPWALQPYTAFSTMCADTYINFFLLVCWYFKTLPVFTEKLLVEQWVHSIFFNIFLYQVQCARHYDIMGRDL